MNKEIESLSLKAVNRRIEPSDVNGSVATGLEGWSKVLPEALTGMVDLAEKVGEALLRK